MSNEKLTRMDQLLAFCDWEEKNTEKVHIARWAVDEIERLREERGRLLNEINELRSKR